MSGLLLVPNLVKPEAAIFKAGHFVETGQWMDGWESRRSFGRARKLDHDWCILRLGAVGVIKGVDIDTSHFRGNAPEYATVEASFVIGELYSEVEWVEILSTSELKPNQHNLFELSDTRPWTHLPIKYLSRWRSSTL